MKAATLCGYPDFMKGWLGVDHNYTPIRKLNGNDMAPLSGHIESQVEEIIGSFLCQFDGLQQVGAQLMKLRVINCFCRWIARLAVGLLHAIFNHS